MTKKASKTKSSEVVKPEIKQKNLGGRPTKYTQEIADYICEQMILGRSLTNICSNDDIEGLPAEGTVYKWLLNHNDECFNTFRENYAIAREIQLDKKINNMLSVCYLTERYIDDKGNQRLDPASVAQNKLYIDTLKWTASKLVPKKYGDKPIDEPKEQEKPQGIDEINQKINFLLAEALKNK